jgi:hypothetical protein
METTMGTIEKLCPTYHCSTDSSNLPSWQQHSSSRRSLVVWLQRLCFLVVGFLGGRLVWTPLNFDVTFRNADGDSHHPLLAENHNEDVYDISSVQSFTYEQPIIPKQEPHDPPKQELLLTVPFYIYPELIMLNATIENQTLLEISRLPGRSRKHDDDLMFLLAALRHPMRTRDPFQAKLFVVPFLASFICSSIIYQTEPVCFNGMCGKQLIEFTNQVLDKSPFFLANNRRRPNKGNNHILTNTYFRWFDRRIGGRFDFRNLYVCHWIQFGEGAKQNGPRRLRFNAMYVGSPCNIASEAKTHDLAFVANLQRSPKRPMLCEWISGSRYRMEFCGEGPQCPTLARAKLGFHVAGDSISSQRLFDTLLSRSIPVFTEPIQYAVTQSWIDWDKISYFADLSSSNKTRFLADLDRILQNASLLEKKRQQVLANRRLFDWHTLVPFDTYMYMLQAYLYPHHRHNSSPYSALLLD